MNRVCLVCGEFKNELDFAYINKSKYSGNSGRCKSCEVLRVRNWAKSNKEKVNKSSRNRREAMPDKFLAYARDYRKRKPEAIKELGRVSQSKRRARMSLLSNEENNLTPQQWRDIKKKFKNRCYYCNSKKELEIEHVKPIKLGGSNNINNIVPSCKNCNRRKHARSPEEWALTIGKLFL